MRKSTMLFNEEGGEGAGGGGAAGALLGAAPTGAVGGGVAAGGEGEPAQGEALPILSDDGNFSPQWYKGNQDLEPFGKQLDKFQSPAALAKSYATLEKHRSVPAEGSDEAAIEAFRNANGIPQNPNEYEITTPEDLPDGIQVDEASMEGYKELFHKLNLTPHQAQQLSDGHLELTSKMLQNIQGQQHEASQEEITKLQQEWGNSFDGKLATAQNAFEALCTKAGVDPESVNFTGDVAFTKMMAAVAGMTSESEIIGIGGGGQSLKSGKQEAHEIMTNKNHPDYAAFYDPNDPRHIEVQDKVSGLNK